MAGAGRWAPSSACGVAAFGLSRRVMPFSAASGPWRASDGVRPVYAFRIWGRERMPRL